MLVHLGFCRKPHGIKGGFVFKLFSNDESVLNNSSKIILKGIEHSLVQNEFTIKSISFGNKIIVYLNNVDDRNRVEELLPFDIYFERSSFPKLLDHQVYLSDMIGFNVLAEQTNSVIGKVCDFVETPAHINIEIKLETNEILTIPYIDQFVKKINTEKKEIIILLPEFV